MGDVRVVPTTRLLGQGTLRFLGTARYPGHHRSLQVCLPILALVWCGHLHAQMGGGTASHPGDYCCIPPVLCDRPPPNKPNSALWLPPLVRFLAFCLWGLLYDIWLAEGTPMSFFFGYLLCPP